MVGFLDKSNDSVEKTVAVALILCLVCSIVVSSAAVLLKPQQETNQAIDRKKNILVAADLLQGNDAGAGATPARVDELFEQFVEARVVDMQTGEYSDAVDPATYDARKAARDPAMSQAVAADKDIASIKRQANYAVVYLVNDESGKLRTIVLPVKGYGLWSTLYGFLALAPDTKTVVGLKFYEHAETPGLGGEVDNADWLAQWSGKIVYDEQWQPNIRIVKGQASGESEVDGLAGATLTSRGVMYLLQYWLSGQGFGPYLARLRNDQENANAG
jgi:Na+-transporting NADH:ubiquinone oxidoreductase subunit C